MNRRLLTALGASALIVATVMPAGVTAARPKPDAARRFERVDVNKIDKSLVKAILNDHDVNVIVEMRGPAATERNVSRVAPSRPRTAQVPPGRPRRLRAQARGHGRGQVPVRLQRHEAAPAEQQGRGAREAAGRQGHPRRPVLQGRQPAQRAVHRRAVGVAGLRRHRQRPDDRRHRHRHRLHPRQLRRPGHRGGLRRQRLDDHRARHPSRPPRSSPAGTSSATPTTRRTTTGPRSRPRPRPARLQRPRLARRRHGRRVRRQVRPHDLHGPLQRDHLRDLVRHRAGRRAQGQARRRSRSSAATAAPTC